VSRIDGNDPLASERLDVVGERETERGRIRREIER
jgi:hypothetical protein